MIQYFDGGDLACVDGYSFRRDKKTGYFLSSKSIGGHRVRLHVYVWEKIHGTAPKGYEVHHIDKNRMNNEPDNLRAMPAQEHRAIHAEHDAEEKRRLRENLLKNAMPKAKAWHSTEEGKKWHSEHAKETARKRTPIEYVCTNCGKPFSSTHIYKASSNRFCCNACKAAFRSKSGVDNVEKICANCGGTYIENKYRKTQECPACRRKKR